MSYVWKEERRLLGCGYPSPGYIHGARGGPGAHATGRGTGDGGDGQLPPAASFPKPRGSQRVEGPSDDAGLGQVLRERVPSLRDK